MWFTTVQTAALSGKSFCCPQPWPGGTRHCEATWLHMRAALKGLWIKADTSPEIPAPKLAVKNQVTGMSLSGSSLWSLKLPLAQGAHVQLVPKMRGFAAGTGWLETCQEGWGKAVLQYADMSLSSDSKGQWCSMRPHIWMLKHMHVCV